MPAQRTGARRAPTAPSAAAAPDATRLLADDHRQVHALFEDYRKLAESGASGEERRPLAEEICTLLTVHAAALELPVLAHDWPSPSFAPTNTHPVF